MSGVEPNAPISRHPSPLTVWFCSAASLVITFLGLSQFDLPIVRYVRSVTIHIPWQQLTMPWMAFTSDAGNWIGEGTHLVVFSVVLAFAGWLLSNGTLRNAGIETLLAHGLTAVLVNGIKHLVGRPRPKFAHSGEWHIAPSWTSGFDSFPSGHTAASFAVATVLTKRFPAFGPLCMGIAIFVMLSRILRGSHFPTDVLGGAVFGVLSGSIAAAPLVQWRASLREGVVHATMGSCAVLMVLWPLSRPVEEGVSGLLLIGLGLAATVGGLWLRRTTWMSNARLGSRPATKSSLILIAYGLASMTASFYVVAAAGFACMAYWINSSLALEEEKPGWTAWSRVMESLVLVSLLFAMLILWYGRGVMPFR